MLGIGISCSVLADKEIFEFFLKAEMLQDLSDSSIEFQVFGPWNFKLNIL